MGLRKLVSKYKVYEAKELARRKKLAPYKKELETMKRKAIKPVVKKKFDAIAYTKAIGNPYGVKYPKAKKILKKIKKKRVKKVVKKIIIYK